MRNDIQNSTNLLRFAFHSISTMFACASSPFDTIMLTFCLDLQS